MKENLLIKLIKAFKTKQKTKQKTKKNKNVAWAFILIYFFNI